MPEARNGAEFQILLDQAADPIVIPDGVTITGSFICSRSHTIVGGNLVGSGFGPVLTLQQGAPPNQKTTIILNGVTVTNTGEGWISTGEDNTTLTFDNCTVNCTLTNQSSQATFQGTSNSNVVIGRTAVSTTNQVTNTSGAAPKITAEDSAIISRGGSFDNSSNTQFLGTGTGPNNWMFRFCEASSVVTDSMGDFTYLDDSIITGSKINVASILPLTPGTKAAQFSFNQITTSGLCNIQSKTPISTNVITALYVLMSAPQALANSIVNTAPNTPNNIIEADMVMGLKLTGPGGVGDVPQGTFQPFTTGSIMQLEDLTVGGDILFAGNVQGSKINASNNLTISGAPSSFKSQLTNVKAVQVSSTGNAVAVVNLSGLAFAPVTSFTP